MTKDIHMTKGQKIYYGLVKLNKDYFEALDKLQQDISTKLDQPKSFKAFSFLTMLDTHLELLQFAFISGNLFAITDEQFDKILNEDI